MASEADKKKLIFAIVLLIAAGVAIAWNMGLIFSGPKPTPTTAAPPEAGQPRGGGARTAK